MRILYNSKIHKKPFGCLKADEECVIELHIPCYCITTSAQILFFNDDGSTKYEIPMALSQKSGDYDIYKAIFSIDKCDLYFYKFHIVT